MSVIGLRQLSVPFTIPSEPEQKPSGHGAVSKTRTDWKKSVLMDMSTMPGSGIVLLFQPQLNVLFLGESET